MAETLLPLETVMERIHLKRTKIYDMIGRGEFPQPVKIGTASRWPESKIEAWIAARVTESEAGATGS